MPALTAIRASLLPDTDPEIIACEEEAREAYKEGLAGAAEEVPGLRVVPAPHSGKAMLAGADVRAFVLAGKATFTLVNTATGTRLTYRVKKAPNKGNTPDLHRTNAPWFVSVMTGPDNTKSFSYLGCLWDKGAKVEYSTGRKCKLPQNDRRAVAAAWFFKHLEAGMLPATLEVWHEGSCGRCGRKLTVPTSIANGIGPECAKVGAK